MQPKKIDDYIQEFRRQPCRDRSRDLNRLHAAGEEPSRPTKTSARRMRYALAACMTILVVAAAVVLPLQLLPKEEPATPPDQPSVEDPAGEYYSDSTLLSFVSIASQEEFHAQYGGTVLPIEMPTLMTACSVLTYGAGEKTEAVGLRLDGIVLDEAIEDFRIDRYPWKYRGHLDSAFRDATLPSKTVYRGIEVRYSVEHAAAIYTYRIRYPAEDEMRHITVRTYQSFEANELLDRLFGQNA